MNTTYHGSMHDADEANGMEYMKDEGPISEVTKYYAFLMEEELMQGEIL